MIRSDSSREEPFFFQFGLFLLELIRLGADLLYCGKCCFNTGLLLEVDGGVFSSS